MTFCKLTFLKCYILSLQDPCVSYPCCQNCVSKLHRSQTEQKYRCPKCGFACEIENVHHRYKLSVKVARDCDVFGLTLFGSSLNPHFGASAVCLQRLVEQSKAECSQTDVQQLLAKAVEDCFVGRCFLFGLKMSDFDIDGSSSSSPKRRRISGSFIASRIVLPGAAVISCPVVTYFKDLLKAAQLSELGASQQPGKLPETQQNDSSTIFNSCECTLASHGRSHSQHTSGSHDDLGYFQQSLGIITFLTEYSYSEQDGSPVADPPKERRAEGSGSESPSPSRPCFCPADTDGKCSHKETLCSCDLAALEEDGNSSVFLWEDKSFSEVSGEFISKAARSSEALTEDDVCTSEKDAKLTSIKHSCELQVQSLHSSQTQERNRHELESVVLREPVPNALTEPWALPEDGASHLSHWDVYDSKYMSDDKDYTEESASKDGRAERQTEYYFTSAPTHKEPDGKNVTICDCKCETEGSPQSRVCWLEDIQNCSLDLFNSEDESKGEGYRSRLSLKRSSSGTLRPNPKTTSCKSDLSGSLDFLPFSQSTPISKNIQYKCKNQVQRDRLLTEYHLKRHYDDYKAQGPDKCLSTPESDLKDLVLPSVHKIPHHSLHKSWMGSTKTCACSEGGGCTGARRRNLGGGSQRKSDTAHTETDGTEAKPKGSPSRTRAQNWECPKTANVERSHQCTVLKRDSPCNTDIPSSSAEASSLLCNWSADLFTD